jgi:hypothetical protein
LILAWGLECIIFWGAEGDVSTLIVQILGLVLLFDITQLSTILCCCQDMTE